MCTVISESDDHFNKTITVPYLIENYPGATAGDGHTIIVALSL